MILDTVIVIPIGQASGQSEQEKMCFYFGGD